METCVFYHLGTSAFSTENAKLFLWTARWDDYTQTYRQAVSPSSVTKGIRGVFKIKPEIKIKENQNGEYDLII